METNQFAEFVSAVVKQLPRDISPTAAQGWIQNQEALANALRKALAPAYRLVVDYAQSLAQMIAAGRYDYANSDITSGNFPTTANDGKQEVVVELAHFGRDMESDAVLKKFEARGLRAATLPELLAFGATYPEKQREFPIVALGSVRRRDVDRVVPYLNGDGSKRLLYLSWIDNRWNGRCRFAAVRK